MQILYQIMVREHLMEFADFFIQTHPPLHATLTEVLNGHFHDRTHPREGIDHRVDQRAVSETD